MVEHQQFYVVQPNRCERALLLIYYQHFTKTRLSHCFGRTEGRTFLASTEHEPASLQLQFLPSGCNPGALPGGTPRPTPPPPPRYLSP